MTDVKTNLGEVNKEIIEEGPVQGRSMLTYVLVAVAVIMLIYIVYSKWFIHQPFWTREKSSECDDDPDPDDKESKKEKKKKEDPKEDSDDWSVEEGIKKIEIEQDRLFKHREDVQQ